MKLSLALLTLVGSLLAAGDSLAADRAPAFYTNPVLAGDYPDPSVIRVGEDYWATATSSEWGPQFPLLHSRDLVNWEIRGHIFPNRPAWAVANFWAPEIQVFRGRCYLYYVGRRQNGPLSVAVATADRPEGPWTDHGPIISQEAGSIDPVATLDETGQPVLIWKEDGNSRRLPTPIWAQRLSPDGLRPVGEPRELLRNDAPWEGGLVEGPFVLRHNGWFYMFYSGNGCCGRDCTYALGVARARALFGPWEKNPANPILAGNAGWKCPGHGSIVTSPDRRFWLLYHAYDTRTTVFTGREMLLDEVRFGVDGWPTINEGRGPSLRAAAPHGVAGRNNEFSFRDDFTTAQLRPGWQWPQDHKPRVRIDPVARRLRLQPAPGRGTDPVAAVLARSATTGDYTAATAFAMERVAPGTAAGLAAFGDSANGLGVFWRQGKLSVWHRQNKEQRILAEREGVRPATVHLRVTVTGGNRFRFAYSENGRSWQPIGETADGGYLPPWDRSIRVALTVGGSDNPAAAFDYFAVAPSSPRRAATGEKDP